MLSAVSQQVQNIQLGLLAATHDPEHEIELVGRQLKINAETGIFISTLTNLKSFAGKAHSFIILSHEPWIRWAIQPA